jgi:hypothetical protein
MYQSGAAQLLLELERLVLVRTSRRVRDLAIEMSPERVVIRGRTSSFYVKQLAQHGVREMLPHICLENTIAVDDYRLSPVGAA